MPKLNRSDQNNLIKRLQGVGSCSAEEELLLVWGFALEFGVDAIKGPIGNKDKPRPEFIVCIEHQNVSIEAKGLLDSKEVRELNEFSKRSGQYYWISVDPSIGDPSHVRGALVQKILKSIVHSPCIIVLTLYGPFDFLAGIDLARQMAITPFKFGISEEAYPLADALVFQRLIQGVWFNDSEVQKIDFDRETRDRIRKALQNSFYPRDDGVFFHEGMTDDDHNATVNKILNRGR